MLDFPIKTINYIKNNLLKQQKEVEKDLKEIEGGRLLAMPTAEYCLSDSKKISK